MLRKNCHTWKIDKQWKDEHNSSMKQWKMNGMGNVCPPAWQSSPRIYVNAIRIGRIRFYGRSVRETRRAEGKFIIFSLTDRKRYNFFQLPALIYGNSDAHCVKFRQKTRNADFSTFINDLKLSKSFFFYHSTSQLNQSFSKPQFIIVLQNLISYLWINHIFFTIYEDPHYSLLLNIEE